MDQFLTFTAKDDKRKDDFGHNLIKPCADTVPIFIIYTFNRDRWRRTNSMTQTTQDLFLAISHWGRLSYYSWSFPSWGQVLDGRYATHDILTNFLYLFFATKTENTKLISRNRCNNLWLVTQIKPTDQLTAFRSIVTSLNFTDIHLHNVHLRLFFLCLKISFFSERINYAGCQMSCFLK